MNPEQVPDLIRETFTPPFGEPFALSFFVSISYMCWAYRRQGVTLDAGGKIQNWLY